MTQHDRPAFAAVDLGASSGRVVAGVVADDTVQLHTVHRFTNALQRRDGHLRWDLTGLYSEVLTGLVAAVEAFPHLRSIGVNAWGVDYGLLDTDGTLFADPISYRDERTDSVVEQVHERVSRDRLFEITGLQYLPFNTIYQLAAEAHGPAWSRASRVVMVPDLIAYWLTGELRTEATIASTTGLVDVRSGRWSAEILSALGISSEVLPPIEQPGTIRGRLRDDVRARIGADASTVVTTVAAHDTASAVVAIPATDEQFAYISSGTWSLVGLELDAPILTTAARDANFTNELGVDGRNRFLRNVGGLWLLEECIRSWADAGNPLGISELLADAASIPDTALRIDVDDPRFVAPGGMPDRIAQSLNAAELSRGAVVRCIVDSLADAYARTMADAGDVAKHEIEVVHIVGGGSQNELLCALTAERTGLPVIAGPTEATALGNVLVQARAHGALPPSLDQLRTVVARSTETRRFEAVGAKR